MRGDPLREVAAVILGAGLGRRLGMGPKAFIRYNDATLLDHAVWLIKTAGVRRICAVLPPLPDPEPPPEGILIARNPDADSGPLVSLGYGIDVLGGRDTLDRVLVHHVDHPHVDLTDLENVLERSAEELDGVSRVVPSWEGRGGHPITILPPALDILCSDEVREYGSLKDLLSASGETEYVEAQNSGVVLNWNTPREMGFIESEDN